MIDDPWDKMPEDSVEGMRIVDAEGQKTFGADNESVEQLAFGGRIVLNKCDLLFTGRLQTEIIDGEDCLDVESAEVERVSRRSNGIVNDAGRDASSLHALEDRIRSVNPHEPIVRTNSCNVDSKALLNMSVFSLENMLEKGPDFLQFTDMTILTRLHPGVSQGLSEPTP